MSAREKKEVAEVAMNENDIKDMERLLDELAIVERSSAPFALESRVLAGVLPVVARRAPAPVSMPIAAGARRMTASPMRAAAAMALAASVFAALLGSRESSRVATTSAMAASAEREVEGILAISAAFEDTATTELSSLSSETTTLGERIRQGWSGAEWLGEGAM